jgi:hypothetical protein
MNFFLINSKKIISISFMIVNFCEVFILITKNSVYYININYL